MADLGKLNTNGGHGKRSAITTEDDEESDDLYAPETRKQFRRGRRRRGRRRSADIEKAEETGSGDSKQRTTHTETNHVDVVEERTGNGDDDNDNAKGTGLQFAPTVKDFLEKVGVGKLTDRGGSNAYELYNEDHLDSLYMRRSGNIGDNILQVMRNADLDDGWPDGHEYDVEVPLPEDFDSPPNTPEEPTYPMGEQKYAQCQICFEAQILRFRHCCKFAACDNCLQLYFTTQVSQGIVKIECLNTECLVFVHRDEILHKLEKHMKEKFYKFLVDANKEPHIKTCPQCSSVLTVHKHELYHPKARKKGLKVTCPDCALVWCFSCQAPWHEGISCKAFRKGDKQLKSWAREYHYGQKNAQRCPKCKTFIQRTTGCDHMACSQCGTSFCYLCGERFRSLKFFGGHFNRLSVFGCKFRLMPENPGARRFIRGLIFSGKLAAAPLLGGIAVGAGAVLLGLGVVLTPFYLGLQVHKFLKHQKRVKRQQKASEIIRMKLDLARIKGYELEISSPLSATDNLEELDPTYGCLKLSTVSNSMDQVATVDLSAPPDDSSTSSSSEDEGDNSQGKNITLVDLIAHPPPDSVSSEDAREERSPEEKCTEEGSGTIREGDTDTDGGESDVTSEVPVEVKGHHEDAEVKYKKGTLVVEVKGDSDSIEVVSEVDKVIVDVKNCDTKYDSRSESKNDSPGEKKSDSKRGSDSSPLSDIIHACSCINEYTASTDL